ncbi:MAG: RnfABCDGE type electron transport complex subunit G [Bacteroidales bacterium]|nr:RnfABCDGE type electron transport complex subunit G [Bacteroidales bacterium]
MKKKPSTLKNMVVSLTLIAGAAALSVGIADVVTAEPIALAKQARLEAAIRVVLPEFDRLEEPDTITVDGGELIFYMAYNNDEFVGTAIATFSNRGFSGQIRLMAGFLPDGTIYNIDVLRHSETPGLGDKIEHRKSTWPQQFRGQNPATFNLRVRKDGGDVDAITAATITARAYTDAVQRAFDALAGTR